MKVYYCDICGKEFEKTKEQIVIRNPGCSSPFYVSMIFSRDNHYYDLCNKCLKEAMLEMLNKW